MRGPWSRSRITLLSCIVVGLAAGAWSAPTAAQDAGACTVEIEPNERPEMAQVLSGGVCLQGDLAKLTDQDLFIWDIAAVDALHTWTFTTDGVPTTITSIRLFRITSPAGSDPVVDPHELLRVDSSADDRAPGITADVSLAPGRYLLGISRGAPVGGGDLSSGPYTARVQAQGVVPPVGDVEPNDDAASATPLSSAFELSGDAAGSPDVYAWTITDGDIGSALDVSVRMPFAAQGSSNLTLSTSDGRVLTSAPIGPDGVARIYDLRLPAGTYLLGVPAAASGQPYVLSSAPSSGDSSDAEPNDSPATAVMLDPTGGPVSGRLAIDRDTDFYHLPVDAALAAIQFDVALTWVSGPARQLCLYRDTNTLVQCADPEAGAAVLSNLQLPVGGYTVQVLGDEGPADGYRLAISDVGPVRADREVEPNDDGLTASALDPKLVMTGRADASDDDVYRVTVTGEQPKTWRLDATGAGLELLEWVGRDGHVLAGGEVSGDATHASLWDLYLVPGDHWLHVRASGGDYQLALTPLGGVDGATEREPNNDLLTAQVLPVDGARSGRLPVPSDTDVFRFSLEAADHVALELAPAADAAIELQVTSGGTTLASFRDPVAGVPVSLDRTLWPGDYEVTLRSDSRSVSPYALRLDRVDPFLDPDASARPVPLSSLAVSLTPVTSEVAAWSTWGQRVAVELLLVSTADTPTPVTVDAILSDHDWTLEPITPEITIAANGNLSVPLVVRVPPDAPADVPVRITVRATAGDGASITASTDLTPRREAALVEPYQAWPVPDPLLGGLDVASLAVGGVPYLSSDPVREVFLHDGVALTGTGFSGQPAEGALTMSVDLAGDAPVLVAGTIVNSLAFDGALQYRPRDFELLLSDDGTAWSSALTGTLSPLSVDQSFVLPHPVAARFARLRITSAYGSDAAGTPFNYAPLGEWKVVAVPGTAPEPAPLNIADPVRDGHIVWMDPQPATDGFALGMLSEDPTPWLPYIAHGRAPQFVVGFHDDRAAQVTEMQWVDPPGSTPATRPARATLDVSLDSPSGPWQPVGVWQLERAPDGSVSPFAFAPGTWARFVRVTPDAPSEADSAWEMPSTLRVLERPTDDVYRSILGEWGMGSSLGILELTSPPVLGAIDEAADDDDTPDTATPLVAGQVARGSVHRQQDEDWYVIRMPPVHDQLTLDLTGEAYAGATVEIFDAEGAPVAATVADGQTAGSLRVTATVLPETSYRLRVSQPPVSVDITYDTSGSLGPYLSYVGQALRSFASGVTPGNEAVRIVPFEDPSLLDDWSDDPYALESAVESQVLHSFSSGVEAAMLEAAKQVGGRSGTRAILVMSDGVTLSYGMRDAMWQRLSVTHPLVYAVHVAGGGDPALSTRLMQDLASTGGQYQYAVSHGDIDGAFDRVATRLRGPAVYGLSFGTAEIPKLPGTIGVRSLSGARPAIGGDVAIELVLDTSGSMKRTIGKQRRIDIAKTVLGDLVTDTLPAGIPVALRTFQAGGNSCSSQLAVPLRPLDQAAMAAKIARISVGKGTKTPLGFTLHQVASDLAGVDGPTIVVLVTDGRETCKGDPAAEIEALVAQGFDIQLNIVGFAIDDAGLRADLAHWAELGHGTAYDAGNAKDLSAALEQALAAPFRIYDQAGVLVGSGAVGGHPVGVPAGTYRVEVLTDPSATFAEVVVGSGAGVDLVLGADPAP